MAEARIFETYNNYGAKLVDAHGSIRKSKMKVPEGTVIMFLANPGLCMLQAAARRVADMFFMNRKGLETFFQSGGSKRNVAHVSDILKRTHFSGETINDTTLEFKDTESKKLGYVKKLPLTSRQYILPGYYTNEKAPTFAETTGPLNVYGKQVLLSQIIAETGPGVYIVSSCRAPLGNAKSFHTPHPSSWPYITPVKGAKKFRKLKTPSAKPGLKRVLRLPAPGASNALLKMEIARKKTKPFENKIKNVLAHMIRNYPVPLITQKKTNVINPSSNANLRKYVAPLPANTNLKTLRYVLGALKNKNTIGSIFQKLSLKNKAIFLGYPSKRGELVYKVLRE
jgi:hypothetical protein